VRAAARDELRAPYLDPRQRDALADAIAACHAAGIPPGDAPRPSGRHHSDPSAPSIAPPN
jgi:hypothetical protein